MSYAVAQLGARRHYAVPRILHGAGLLDRFYTDICATKSPLKALDLIPERLRPRGVRRLIGRAPDGIPAERLTAFNLFGLEYARRRRAARSAGETVAVYLWAGQKFCDLVIRHGFGTATGLYAYHSAALEALQAARARGGRTVLEQTIAPRRIENGLLRQESERFPDWERPSTDDCRVADFCAREEAEWRLADRIICGSTFVRDGIAACGGPADRCAVVPQGVDARFRLPPREPHGGPLRVLVVGSVGLRKGAPYVLAAARMLKGRAAFRMVGPLEILPPARAALADAVELTGAVPRSDILAHFAWADVFLLPSLCEGSANVVYEALAAGLPVICTPNTGSIVRDGLDGVIVPIRDPDAIADAVERLASSPELRSVLANNAGRRLEEISIEAYGRRLVEALAGQRHGDAV